MKEEKDLFGNRMKLYEAAEAERRLMPLLPAICRIDGKCFSGYSRGMERPYDKRLSDLMVDLTVRLVKETNACMGYTASDEITLAWLSTSFDSQIFFDGRIQKMTSVLASMATAIFNDQARTILWKDRPQRLALFDCRVWNVPNVVEGANAFLWREQDATKNSISQAARTLYSAKELHGKSGAEMQEMLHVKGVNWNNYPSFFKRGTFVQRRKIVRKFTVEELDRLPPLHEARKNPELGIERTDYRRLAMPPFTKVVNRPEVVFEGEEPKTTEEQGGV